MGTGAHHTVTRHPVHLTVILLIQPGLQPRLFQRQVGITDTHLLKAERQPPLFNIQGELIEIERMRHE